MLDVEFLLLDPPVIDRPIVYLYRSGALRTKVLHVFRDEMDKRGFPLAKCDPSELASQLFGGGLFPAAALCEWATESSKRSESVDFALSALAMHKKGDCAVVIPSRSAIVKHPLWTNVCANALVIEEPILTSESLPPILRYLQASTDLKTPADLRSQRAFVEGFADLIESGDSGFLEAKFRFIELVLTQTDAVTQEFVPGFDESQNADRRASETTFKALRNMTDVGDKTSARQFVVAIESLFTRGDTAQTVIAKLYRSTARLLRFPNSAGRSSFNSKVADDPEVPETTLVWAALLCSWEVRLLESGQRRVYRRRREPDMRVVEWDRLVQEFQSRARRKPGSDPLVDRWADLRRAVASAGGNDRTLLAKYRTNILLRLRALLPTGPDCGQLDWSRSLHKLLEDITEPEDDD